MHFASSDNQKKDNNQFKNKQQSTCLKIEVWKFNNQGVKEETLIQTSRRGGDRQPRKRGHEARWWLPD